MTNLKNAQMQKKQSNEEKIRRGNREAKKEKTKILLERRK
jgi:hypothetical protein